MDGCDRIHYAKGLCNTHWKRLRRHGDPAVTKRSEVVTYEGAHQRVRKVRGRAVDQPCAHCAERAAQWAYDHADPEAITGLDRNGRGVVNLMAYSLDPDHYIPLCQPCHVRFDQQPAA